ncbi:MAG: sugar ABC transporter ATP-binding protein [Rectinemataceae bacterium]
MTPTSAIPSKVLEVYGVGKDFPGVRALNAVDFELREGEIHALLGENGAGKSTLIKILGGIYQPDCGTIALHGKPCSIRNPRHARSMGIGIVHQELNLFPVLSVGENVTAGDQPAVGFLRFVNRRAVREKTRSILETFDIDLDPDMPVRMLSIAQQQVVEIVHALLLDIKVLILDEPTSALTEKETEFLFSTMKRLKLRGISIIYISHRLEEVFEIADRVTVLRDGSRVDTAEISSVTMNSLIKMMVGRSFNDFYGHSRSVLGDEVMRVTGLTRKGKFHDVSFALRSGEILGLAGLIGAGRTEVARAIFGADRLDAGQIELNGKSVRVKDPKTAIRLGISYLTENRRLEGLFHGMSIRENTSVTHLRRFTRLGMMDRKAESLETEGFRERLKIQTPDIARQVSTLSGGNQQKVVLARWLAINPKVLMIDEPTRGIDVGAKSEIYSLLRDLASKGVAILLISSELPEIMGISDRIVVMYEGRITGVLAGTRMTQENIMALASGQQTLTQGDEVKC